MHVQAKATACHKQVDDLVDAKKLPLGWFATLPGSFADKIWATGVTWIFAIFTPGSRIPTHRAAAVPTPQSRQFWPRRRFWRAYGAFEAGPQSTHIVAHDNPRVSPRQSPPPGGRKLPFGTVWSVFGVRPRSILVHRVNQKFRRFDPQGPGFDPRRGPPGGGGGGRNARTSTQ